MLLNNQLLPPLQATCTDFASASHLPFSQGAFPVGPPFPLQQQQQQHQHHHLHKTKFSADTQQKDGGSSSAFCATRQSSKNLSEADNIKVAVRVRPLLPHEKEKGATSVLNVPEDHSTVEVVMPGPSGNKLQRDFQFHACLGPDTTQTEVMQLCGVHQLLDAVLAGYNVTIFAYGIQPPPVLLDALLLRVSVLLPELGPQEMVQVARALVALQYRPSDAWLSAFVAQCRTHLPALAGDDLGMLLWALSSLGTPMDQEWLLAYCREAARGWTTHTGESLGRMAWGLSQYNFSPFSSANPESGPAPAAPANALSTEQVFELPAPRYDDMARLQQQGPLASLNQQPTQAVLSMTRKEEAWWSGFYRACGERWHTASPQALVLLLLGVAQLVCSAPDREWQRGLMRALRLSIPRPPTSDSVLPMLLMVAGLVPPSSDANADPSSAGAKADPSSVGANADPSSAAGQSPLGVAQPVGASPASLAALQPTAVSRAGGAQDGGPLLQGQQQEFMPPRMSKEEVLAVLPPQAAQSVWLAAFLTELKAQWGMGRML